MSENAMKNTSTLAALIMLLVASCVGCAEDSTESPGPQAPTHRRSEVDATPEAPLPPEVSALRLYIAPNPAAPGLTQVMQAALASAGYTLIVDPRAGVDVSGQLTASVAAVPSMFHVQVNGVERTKRRYAVTLSLLAGGQILDQASAQFETDGPVSPGRLQPIVAVLSTSPRLVQFARGLQSKRAAEASVALQRGQEAAATTARVEEETMWNQARITACELPVSLTGCDAVRLYLAKYPQGAHVEEASKALAAAQPQLEKLQKDENNWQQAGVATCRSHAGTDPCVGVELYLQKHAAGLHADEAQALLNPSQTAQPPPPTGVDPRVRLQECCTALRVRGERYLNERPFLFGLAAQCDRVVAGGDSAAFRQRLAERPVPPACQGL
jgi:hypothetical protein